MMKSHSWQEWNLNKIDLRLYFLKALLVQEKLPVPKLSHSKSTFHSFTCQLKLSWVSIMVKVKKNCHNSGKLVNRSVKSSFSSTKSMHWLEVEIAICMRPVEESFRHCWGRSTVLSRRLMSCWFVRQTGSRILMQLCWAELTWV